MCNIRSYLLTKREVVTIMIFNFSGFNSKIALHATFRKYKNSSFLMLVISMA